MPDEPNSVTGGVPTPPTPPAPAPRNEPEPDVRPGRFITCQVCESQLHANGDSKKKSQLFKDLEKAGEQLAEQKVKYDQLKAEYDALKNPPSTADPPSRAKKHLHLAAS